jgi:hypothetical protein
MWLVDDIDAIYTEFRNQDIELADDLRTLPYGPREFAFIVINGYYIRVAERTEEE